jgi:thioredoxin reductase (NADPH)
MSQVRDIVIIGSGAAGCTAAIYAARANFAPLVLEGAEPGGQLTITTEVENFPGFPEGIQGPELMERMKAQAERFGAEFQYGTVESVDFSARPYKLTVDGDIVEAKTVVIATGASARWLGMESEERFRGQGVSACATCDGFFFKGQEIAIVGGGDSAMEEAIFLTKFASRVHVVHRRDALRASKIMSKRAHANEKISFVWNSVIEEVLGNDEDGMTGLTIKSTTDGSLSKLDVTGLFVAIGHTPNTDPFVGHVELDEAGFVVPYDMIKTSKPGVFVAGDVADTKYQQAVSAAGTGCMAALAAEALLAEEE